MYVFANCFHFCYQPTIHPSFICSYEHVVYALDGLLYTLTFWPQDATDICKLEELLITPSKSEEVDTIKAKYGIDTDEPKNIKFFLRSESIRAKEETEKSNEQFFTIASSPGPSNDPYHDSFPFPKQPHLLQQSFTSKDQLFGSPRSNIEHESKNGANNGDHNGGGDGGALEKMEDDSSEQQLVISYSHLKRRYMYMYIWFTCTVTSSILTLSSVTTSNAAKFSARIG